MDKNKICEAMYALPGSVVVKRRKPMLASTVLLLAGLALIVSSNLAKEALSADIQSSMIFLGGILAVAGLIMLMARIFSSGGVPFHNVGRCYLRYEELYFEPGTQQRIVECVGNGNVQELLGMRQAKVPSVTVAVFRTPDNRFAAMQAYEYTDLEYRPLTELKIVSA